MNNTICIAIIIIIYSQGKNSTMSLRANKTTFPSYFFILVLVSIVRPWDVSIDRCYIDLTKQTNEILNMLLLHFPA